MQWSGVVTQSEAIRIACEVAVTEGWPWCEPIVVTQRRVFFLPGPATWHVMSNADCRGMNVNIRINDATGEIVSKAFAPR